MMYMEEVLSMWGQSGFKDALRESIVRLNCDVLPLQAGLTAGSYALDNPVDAVIIHTGENSDEITARVGIFYRSLMPGCACAGDPTEEDTQTEYCVVHVGINRHTAETIITLVEE